MFIKNSDGNIEKVFENLEKVSEFVDAAENLKKSDKDSNKKESKKESESN